MSLSDQHEEQCELHCNLRLLRDIPLFSGVSSDFLRVMAYLCDRQVFVAGQTIVTVGDPADAAIILVHGTARIERGVRHVATVGEGLCIGGLALLGQFRWLYSVRAATEVDCLLLPRHKILPQFLAQPESMASVARELIDSVVGWDQRQLEVPHEMRWDGLGML